MDNVQKNNDEWSFSDKLAVALACLAGAMTLVLFWIDKTPLAATLSIACIPGLLIYPILHFIHTKPARIPVFIVTALLVGVFGWKIWPRKVVFEATAQTPYLPLKPPSPQPLASPETETPELHGNTSARKRADVASATIGVVATAVQQPPQQVISAPNGIAIGGGTVTNPTVTNNNFGPPPAKLSYKVEACPSDTAGLICMKLHIKTDRSIPGARIGILFSGPYEPIPGPDLAHPETSSDEPSLLGTSVEQLSWGVFTNNQGVSNPNALGIIVNMPAAFTPSMEMVVPVKSKGAIAVKLVGVVDF